jgi:hypothetical protein
MKDRRNKKVLYNSKEKYILSEEDIQDDHPRDTKTCPIVYDLFDEKLKYLEDLEFGDYVECLL